MASGTKSKRKSAILPAEHKPKNQKDIGAAIRRRLATEVILVNEHEYWKSVNKDDLEHRWLPSTHLQTFHSYGKGVIRVKVTTKQFKVFVKWIKSTDLMIDGWGSKASFALMAACKRYCLPGVQRIVESKLNDCSRVLCEINTSHQQMNLAFNNQEFCDVTFTTQVGTEFYANSAIIEARWMSLARLEKITEIRGDKVIHLDLSDDIVMIILKWIYFEEVRTNITDQIEVTQLIMACRKYRLFNLVRDLRQNIKWLIEEKALLGRTDDQLKVQLDMMTKIITSDTTSERGAAQGSSKLATAEAANDCKSVDDGRGLLNSKGPKKTTGISQSVLPWTSRCNLRTSDDVIRTRKSEFLDVVGLGAASRELLKTEIILVDINFIGRFLVNKAVLKHRCLPISRLSTMFIFDKHVMRVEVHEKILTVIVKWINSAYFEINGWTREELLELVAACKRYCLPVVQSMAESQLNGSPHELCGLNTSVQQMKLAFNNPKYCDVTLLAKFRSKFYANSVIIESQWMPLEQLEKMARVRDDKEIQLDVPGNILMIMLKWIYFEEAEIATLNHQQLNTLMVACIKYRLVNLGHKVKERWESLDQRREWANDKLFEHFSLTRQIVKDHLDTRQLDFEPFVADLLVAEDLDDTVQRTNLDDYESLAREWSKLTVSTVTPEDLKRAYEAEAPKSSKKESRADAESCAAEISKPAKEEDQTQMTAKVEENMSVAEPLVPEPENLLRHENIVRLYHFNANDLTSSSDSLLSESKHLFLAYSPVQNRFILSLRQGVTCDSLSWKCKQGQIKQVNLKTSNGKWLWGLEPKGATSLIFSRENIVAIDFYFLGDLVIERVGMFLS